VKSVQDKTLVDLLLTNLSRGEAETLVLAREIPVDLVLIDEKSAKAKAIFIGLRVWILLIFFDKLKGEVLLEI
jgi:predicted nucleic acid-binding protein